MSDLLPFPDIEARLIDLIEDLAPTDTVAPADLIAAMPFNRITRFGGGDDFITDIARVDIDSFAATRAAARTLAESVRQRLLAYPHVVGSDVIDRISTDTGPHEIAWGDPNVRRFTASYTVSTRR